MAKFDDIGSGSLNDFGQIISGIVINTFDRLVRGMVFEMMSANVNNFNLMNYDFMKFHMFRNAYEKEVTLNTLGENAYTDGNSDATATPALYPSYTKGNNYMEFVTNTREAEKRGILTTRSQKTGDENTNYYLDMDNGENQVEFTGSFLDRNSILYKTKKLMRQHKLKTIVSQFHTEGVEYNGQVGSKYGESHGRNLLTKEAENGSNDYLVNGYDNPYCRVWTHHYKYDTIAKTMRANSNLINYWEGFGWNNTDKGHKKDNSEYGDGEKYDYAWRGKHNQDRREVHSVLDSKTGLIKVTPQYRGGGETNRHTKDCMFSIENLAWKDYDPYSFEQALSWEQRGPLGGRIMWFPPYGIEISETASAKWQPNDFIGRGEPVYTYVNSERSGNLSFLMITDHPSSIDYASWWDDNNTIKSVDNGQGNNENDYLRYFAGCNDDNSLVDETKNDLNDSKTGGLIVKPTPLTDEYTDNTPLIKKELQTKQNSTSEPPGEGQENDKTPTYVEFFVFFPNNYSGVWDKPTKKDADVNSMAYLLGGRNTMKLNQKDIPLDINSSKFDDGYEMKKSIPITTFANGEYIQGGMMNTEKYEPDPDKKWWYRIDHKQPYTGGNNDPKNTINQQLHTLDGKGKDPKNNKNYTDIGSNQINLMVNATIESHAIHKDSIYSFAEVAAALYSERILNQPILYKHLVDCGVNIEKVNKLIELFTNNNQKLTEILCEGAASSQGTKTRNNSLSVNRANTILDWVRTNTKYGWNLLENTWDETPKVITVDKKDEFNVNGDSAKLGRCAHCVMTFTSGSTESTTKVKNTKTEQIDIVGFRYVGSVAMPNDQIWRYYEKDGSVQYFNQKAGSSDNYDNPESGDIVVNEEQIFDIFRTLKPNTITIIKNNPKYRGLYNERGFYIDTFNYNEEDEPRIIDFDYTQSKNYTFTSYVYDNGRLYKPSVSFYCDVTGKTKEEIWLEYGDKLNDISNLMIKYSEGDYVLLKNGNNEIFYECLADYISSYPDFGFDVNDWDEVTVDNINEAIVLPYKYVTKQPNDILVNDIVYLEAQNVFELCTKINTLKSPDEDIENWELLYVTEFIDSSLLVLGEYQIHNGDLYICVDDTEYTEEFNIRNWSLVSVQTFCNTWDYFTDDVIEYGGNYYKAKKNIKTHQYTRDLSVAMPGLIKDSDNPTGVFDGDYIYEVGDYCLKDNKYYKSKIDFSTKSVQTIPLETALQDGKWVRANYDDLVYAVYEWELAALVKKCAAVLCYTLDEMIYVITGDAEYDFKDNPNYDCVWKYGTTNNLVTPEKVNTTTNLVNYATELQPSSASTVTTESSIKFTSDEEEYLNVLITNHNTKLTMAELRTYIILYRILDGIKKINGSQGTRNVCETADENVDEMIEKTYRKDESETEGCSNIWVDRGDGMLIQECNIDYEIGGNKVNSRFNPETGEGEWNKLRYDQEYHFYKQWIDTHPLMFEKLQEKIKYFNPAFHSMTPEGFNARCTFLQQCTRQGNTKTMSDSGGNTANNLAFGRPPYCVLRLGDFYNQMIVINNISFDYNVSDGIQWDLNTEGNGVQPMLCKVNISFKFIGGGDITGPVQRLQNAMSFNYYANTSFYDNRADRVEYQPTNWKTMGGAGNNEVDLDKSYAYIAKNYETQNQNILIPS